MPPEAKCFMNTWPMTYVAPAEYTGMVSAPTADPMPGMPLIRLPNVIAVVVAVLAGMMAPARLAMTDLPRLSVNGTP